MASATCPDSGTTGAPQARASDARDAEPTPRSLDDILKDGAHLPRWIGWRLRLLVVAVLAGCLGLFGQTLWLTRQTHLHAHWVLSHEGRIQVGATDNLALRPFEGRTVEEVIGAGGHIIPVDSVIFERSSRWIDDDLQRERYYRARAALSRPFAAGGSETGLTLKFTDGSQVRVTPAARGLADLPLVYWVLCSLALVLYLVAMVVILAGPGAVNLAYALMALAQCGNLLFIALEASLGVAMPRAFPSWDWVARGCFDLVTAAAMLQIAAMHPTRAPMHRLWSALGWLAALAIAWACYVRLVPHAWWWVQVGCAALGAAALLLISLANRRAPHPFRLVLRRFGIITLGSWLLLTCALAASLNRPDLRVNVASIGSMIWYVFLASLLLLVPYLSRSQQILREFSLLAATSTVATSLDLLFVAVFSLGPFTSMTLSLFLSLGVYLVARQWILSHLLGNSKLTMERLFERLYRMARELEAKPQRSPALVTRLLRELFEPLEVVQLRDAVLSSRVVSNGAGLVVPVPLLGEMQPGEANIRSLLVRHARKGQHLFTSEDARLTDRIVEQLHRAVAFDRAVEQGRSEERTRIAQDLHDDIGARLLTLMYQAPNPDIEDYIRHTLQDLKTLTRGLAAQNHRLSDAAGEWKADLSQRLALAHCDLQWHLEFDQDIELTMVQWSAMTRILRELVSNTIAHARASRVAVDIALFNDQLNLSVADNGNGSTPENWPHGLGLGGVRKRVKQLGGVVEWLGNEPKGIVCRVHVPRLSKCNENMR
ncbi:sensor histidine kinase [Aquabacterium sp.]|uniref:sensor histidine kinase n=1 Tax=Aquabacterium sp. TaxID=1872578 RepID=UPI0035B43ACE